MHPTGTLSQLNEFLVFVLSLPVWVVAARLYGLYDKDEERVITAPRTSSSACSTSSPCARSCSTRCRC
jgi:hypothetical protein